MENQVNELRVELSKYIKELKVSYNVKMIDRKKMSYKESSLQVKEALLEAMKAKAWLGKFKGYALKSKTPYKKDGKREGVKDIEVEAETANNMVFETFTEVNDNYVFKVDNLREDLKSYILEVEELKEKYVNSVKNFTEDDKKAIICLNNVFTYVSNVRFMLGFELGRVRDNERI